MDLDLRYRSFGECAILVEWPQEICEQNLFDIVAFQSQIELEKPTWLLELIPAAASLGIHVKEGENIEGLIRSLQAIYKRRNPSLPDRKSWLIPVCYDLEAARNFAPDLRRLAESKGMSEKEFVSFHFGKNYTVYFSGFLPGFYYLGTLNSSIVSPRLSTPRKKVAQGSVGIGGQQTGIYAVESAGGWNIVGRTPIQMLDVHLPSASFLKPADYLRFRSIDVSEFDDIEQKVKTGNFSIASLSHE